MTCIVRNLNITDLIPRTTEIENGITEKGVMPGQRSRLEVSPELSFLYMT